MRSPFGSERDIRDGRDLLAVVIGVAVSMAVLGLVGVPYWWVIGAVAGVALSDAPLLGLRRLDERRARRGGYRVDE